MATESNPIKEAAYAYAERGYRLVELHHSLNGCCSCKEAFKCSSKGKHPRAFKWQVTEKPSAADIETMFDHRGNIGIATGPDSGIFVVDVDGERGNETMKALAEAGDVLPPTYTVKTGSGGWHFYFKYPDFEIGNSASTKVGKGVDTRGKGGFVVAPPSVSDKGPYKVVKDLPVAEAPEWLLERLRPKERAVEAVEPKVLADIPAAERQRLDGYVDGAVANEVARLKALHWDGAPSAYRGEPWDNTVFEVACNLVQLANAPWSKLHPDEVWPLVSDNAPRDSGFDNDRVFAKIESAVKKLDGEGTPYPPKPAGAFWLQPDAELPQGLSNDNGSGNALDPFDAAVASTAGDEPPPPPPRVEVVEFLGTPLAGDTLDPGYVQRAKAAALGPRYSSRADIEVVTEAMDEDDERQWQLIQPPASFGADEAMDLTAVDEWIRRSLRSGTPELLWAAVRTIIAGVDTEAPRIVFKGGAPLLALLARILAPAVGDEDETLLAGPRYGTKEVGGDEIVFEFDDTEAIDLAPYAAAIVERANKSTGTLERVDLDTHEELRNLEDYRAAQLHRARLGLGSRPRVEGA